MIGEDSAAKRPLGIMASLDEIGRLGIAPASVDRFRSVLQILNQPAHVLDVGEGAALEAASIATAFLAELRDIRSRGVG